MNNIAGLWVNLVGEMLKNRFKLNDDINNNCMICREICKKVICSSGIDVVTKGIENIPVNESVLIASNHRSFFDIIIFLATINGEMRFAADKQLYSYPILRKYIKSIDCVSVNRKEEKLSEIKIIINEMTNKLKNNLLIVFPEGKCNYFENEINKFEKGAFISAYNCNSFIVPTYICVNKYEKIGRWVIPVDKVGVTFGMPYKAVDISEKIGKNKIADYTRDCVLNIKNNLL